MPATLVDANGVYANAPDREVDSVCPYCGVGCQLTYQIKDDHIVAVEGRDGPANHNRLCVKGRFGFDYVAPPGPPDRAADPQGRRVEARRRDRPGQPLHPFPQGDLGGGARPRRRRAAARSATATGQARAGRLRLGQGVERGGLSVPEAGAHRVRQQQCRSLHAAVPRLVGRGADGGDRLGRGDRALHRRGRRRRDHRDRRAADREPPGGRDLLQAGGQARRQDLRDRPARPHPDAPCDA